MKKGVTLFLLLGIFSATANAGFIPNVEPKNIYGANSIQFGIDNPPEDTCSFHKRNFRFVATTDGGKNILSMLLATKLSGKKINIWYASAENPGTTELNGCTEVGLSNIYQIGIAEQLI